MEKHLNSCVDSETGELTQCLLAPGASYIECRGGNGDEAGLCTDMEPCPNQPACALGDAECQANATWCRQYNIVQAPTNLNSTGQGFVPMSDFCINGRGQFTQERGTVIDPLGNDRETPYRTSCKFGDGTLVQRNLTGDYAACGGDGQVCSTVFAGAYSSSEYDPRYRPWYINTRKSQKPNWTPPYAFDTLGLGITYAEPIYSTDKMGRNVFAGVVGVDYRCE